MNRSAALLLPWLLAASAALANDAEPTVAGVSGLPEGISDAVARVLNPEGYRVELGGAPLADFWFRNELPLEGESDGLFGIELGAVTSSGLVGAVRFHDAWTDYRETDLNPGVYTLRYWIQPADGDHMGVSEYRDFLLICPSDIDVDPEQLFEEEALLELSTKASERVHPAVVAVFPIWDEVEEPSMVLNEIDQWTLAVPLADRTLGIVVEGHGDLP